MPTTRHALPLMKTSTPAPDTPSCRAAAAPRTTTVERSEPAVGPADGVLSPEQVSRPIDAYLPTADQVMAVARTEERLVNDCLVDRGGTGDFADAADPAQWMPFVDGLIADRIVRNTMWGFFDPENAPTFGYARPSADLGLLVPKQPTSGESLPDCQELVSAGTPWGGWVGLTDTGGLPDGGPGYPATDSRYVAAVAAWSACMAQKGFDYPDPITAIGSSIMEQASSGDDSGAIALATADVQCKIDTNLVGQAVAILSAYDQDYIEAHRQQLDDWQASLKPYLDGSVTLEDLEQAAAS
ncbi:MAG: hypothetical protein LBS27_11080 [Bifidobacteriaceae bacterium]|jgi:hypothetical protein|nr:hypothetical protein [Bifidobacteriaceae bacterium]